VFLAIEVTFGVLGAAIFASGTNPRSPNAVGTGIEWGMGIWMVILSIIALYFAGKTAGKLSGATDRNHGMYHGLVVFGMSVFTTVLVFALALGSTVQGTAQANPNTYSVRTIADVIAVGGYWTFVALVLAMIAAGIGGAHGVTQRPNLPASGERPSAGNVRSVA
jgi:hypothetical protein